MKKHWITPNIIFQQFTPNEYISSCYTLVCAIPGSSATEIHDGYATRWFTDSPQHNQSPSTVSINWNGVYVKADGLAHGNCGTESTSYDVNNQIGYEHNIDGSVKNAIITNVHIGSQASKDTYYATWNSNNGTLYTHYGYALMDSNPNHS